MGDNFLVLLFTTKNTMGSKPSTAKPEGGSSSSSSSGGQVEFYWDPVSPPSRCVHMTLMALGEKFVAKHLDLFKGEHKTEEYLKNLRSLPYYDEVNKDANAKLGGLYKAKVEESQAF